jgi:mannitol/fructose-specific phosphotransferase system IIA component (Ntr-type)
MVAREASALESALTLSDFTSPGLIVPHLHGQDAIAVIHELSQAMQWEKRLTDLLPFYAEALNREFLVSSDLEVGMAFPHVRLPGLKRLFFALGRSEEPLRWSVNRDHSVRLVFLMAVPATDATHYLSLISSIGRMARDGWVVEKLHAARANFEMFAVLQKVELRTNKLLTSKNGSPQSPSP